MKDGAQTKRLLVVEPHPALSGLRRRLAESGWGVETTATLLDALVRLARNPMDALLVHESAFPDDPARPVLREQAGAGLGEVRRLWPSLAIVATADAARQFDGADCTLSVPCAPHVIVQAVQRAHESRRATALLADVREENERLKRLLAEQSGREDPLAWTRLVEALPDLDALGKIILELFGQATHAARLSLMLAEGDGNGELRIVQAQGLPAPIYRDTRVMPGEGVAGWVFGHGEPLLAGTRAALPPRSAGAGHYKTDSFLSLPLKAGEEVLGVVNMTERADGRPFTEADVKPMALLAEQAAVWIRHAIRFQKAEEMCLIDPLTTLYNRRHFMSALAREIARADRAGQAFSLALLDIDHFKTYNDAHGHQAGDELLRQIALVLQKSVRAADTVCRYGGEEFTVILPRMREGAKLRKGEGHHFIDRIRLAVSKFPFVGFESQPGGQVTISAGVASFPDDGKSAEELLAAADEMLYQAKAGGRNKVIARR